MTAACYARRARIGAALIAILATGCGGSGAGGADHARGMARPTAARQRPPRKLTGPRARGVPHTGSIDLIALTADGKAALSRDINGGVRFWAALDGSAQPIPVPLRGAVALSLAQRGREAVAAAVDTAGGTHFYRIAADGAFAETAALPPAHKVRSITVLEGGIMALALRDDRSIELVSTDSAQVVGSATKRQFTPTQVLLSADGTRGVAVEIRPGTTEEETELAAYRIGIDAAAVKITIENAAAYTSKGRISMFPTHLALSPDGERLAFFRSDPTTAMWTVATVELATGKERTSSLAAAVSEPVMTGWIASDTLSIDTVQNPRSWWMIGDRTVARPAPSGSIAAMGAPIAYARSTKVMGLGTWMYVQRGRQTRYLGFDSFEPSATAVTPDGRWVAWATNRGQVYIEPVGDERADVVLLETDPLNPVWRQAFVTKDLLITSDQSGGLELVDWRSGKVLDRTDAGGILNTIEVHPSRPIIAVTKSTGQTWVYEIAVERGRFSSPMIADDMSYRAGFYRDGAPDLLWTLDGGGLRRSYRLDELRRGISREEIDKRKELIEGATMAIDPDQRIYRFRYEGTHPILTIHPKQGAPIEVALAGGSIYVVAPSPDATLVAVVVDTGALLVFEAATAKRLWTFPLGQPTTTLAWANDSKTLAIAGLTGGAVVSGLDGTPLRLTCAPWFMVRETAPPPSFASTSTNICSR